MNQIIKTNELTENRVQTNTILNNLCKEFTCTICLHFFTEPISVSTCKHTFCQECLKQWRLKSNQSTSKTFKCPLCKNITTNRSYYLNDKYAIAVKFLNDLTGYMDSKQRTDKSNELLRKYLNDCMIYKLAPDSDEPEIKIDLSNKITKNSKNVDDVVVITESEENEFILNICSTAENINIINKLEDDFITNLENETKTPVMGVKTPGKTPKKNELIDITTPSTSTFNKTTESSKKTGWTRMKAVKRDIKKTAKYKRLKVTKSEEKKRTTRSMKNAAEHFDVFDDYIQEKKNSSTLEKINIEPVKQIENVEIVEIVDNAEDDVFLRSTQILDLENNVTLGKRKSLEDVKTSQQEVQIKKIKTPDKNKGKSLEDLEINKIKTPGKNKRKSLDDLERPDKNNVTSQQDVKTPDKNADNIIIVSADVHHSNDSIISEQIRGIPSENDVIENTEELVLKVDPKLQNMNKELKETLKKVSELKSSVLQSLEQNLKESDNILSEYSNLIYSDSLFSSASNKSTKAKIPTNKICSAPNLGSGSNESITFYNTAIPCLERIKIYFEQLKIVSEHFTEPSIVSINSNNCPKTNDIKVQTDILKCPTCTYTFNLKSAAQIPSKINVNPISNSNSNSEDFNAFLEDVKKNLSSKNEVENNVTIHKLEVEKKRFKRIRAPTESDSDESSEHSKKSKNNSFQSKLIYQDDIEVCFQNSSTSQFHSNIEVNNKNTSLNKTASPGNHKSSEDTLLYLEQQYKNPINISADKTVDNLLSGIDPSVFENDFTVNNTENQNQNKTELSASLFTETQIAKQTIQPKVTDEIPDDCSIVEDSCESDDIFEDDIVDTTPQKPPEIKDINTSLVLKHKDVSNSQLELRKLQKQNITSMTPDFLPLSNIDLNCGFFNASKSSQIDSQTKKLNPLTIIQNEQCSPLHLVKQPQQQHLKNKEVATHQSSILSYVRNNQTSQASEKSNSTVRERCESPVLHSRPILPAILCTSRLQSDENSTIMTCASRLNARYTNVFNKSVTHLVVKVDEDNCVVDQTIKYALAIAHGVWVLNYSWFKDSLNQNRLLPEEPYEVLDMSGVPGPQLSRLNRKKSPIFKNFVFYIAEPVVTATRADLEAVIINLGGEIKSQPNELQNIPGKHCLILAEGKCCEAFDKFETWKNQLNIMIVDIEWLSETVGRFDVTSIRSYALCSDENIEHYGYPDALIEQIPESQMCN